MRNFDVFPWTSISLKKVCYLLFAWVFLLTLFAPSAQVSAQQTGDYPYWNAYSCGGTSSWCWPGDNDNISPYGYVYRNCTDYVAWKLDSLGVPDTQYKGLGHAHMWDNNAPGKGLVVNPFPAVGSVGVSESQHVVFVEAVHSNGTITISEYNAVPIYGGTFGNGPRTGTPASFNLTSFIHFEAYMTINPGSSAVLPARVVIRNGTELWGNNNNGGWGLLSNTAAADKWKLVGDRLVVADSNGLWVKDGNAAWVRWGDSNFQEFQVSASRIVVRNGSELWANANNTGWSIQSYSATAGNWKLDGDRLANYDSNGLWVKDGNGSWSRVSYAVDEFQISPTRIATRVGNTLYKVELNGAYTVLSYSASAGNWKLSGDRFINVDPNGTWVKDGNAAWVRWGDNSFNEYQF